MDFSETLRKPARASDEEIAERRERMGWSVAEAVQIESRERRIKHFGILLDGVDRAESIDDVKATLRELILIVE